jgi:hypothetical protein
MNLKRNIAALGVAALVACPAGAMAKNGNDSGKGHGAKPGAEHGKSKKPKVSTYEFKGLVAGVTGGSVQVTISGGNSRGRKLKGQTLTFDLSQARVKVADANRDGKRDLADVAAGDRVNVQAKLPRGGVDAAQPLPARHFVDKGPAPAKPPTDEESKAPEVPAP